MSQLSFCIMDKLNHTPNWEKVPNNLYVPQGTFLGSPRPTKEVLKIISEQDIQEIDDFFKYRKKLLRKTKQESTNAWAYSEVFVNKEQEGIYCFNGIMLPEEEYDCLDKLKKGDYTIMRVTDLVRQGVASVLTTPNMNDHFELEDSKNTIQNGIYKRNK